MAQVFLDTFAGSGTLAGYASDSGHTYGPWFFPDDGPASFTRSGGNVIGGAEGPQVLIDGLTVNYDVRVDVVANQDGGSSRDVTFFWPADLSEDFSTCFALYIRGDGLIELSSTGGASISADLGPGTPEQTYSVRVDGTFVSLYAGGVLVGSATWDFTGWTAKGFAFSSNQIPVSEIAISAPPAFWTSMVGCEES